MEQDRRWPLWAPLVAFGAAFVLSSSVSAVLLVVTGSVGDEDPPPGVLLGGNLVSQLGLVGFAVFFAWVFGGRPTPADFGIRRPADWRAALGWSLAALVGFYVLTALYAAALGIEEREDLPEQLGADESDTALAAVVVFAVVLAPLVEEFFFRGFLFGTLLRRYGTAVAALVTGVLFGAAHAFGSKLAFLPALALLGVILCLLYWKTGSLYPCIGVHLFNNAVALGVSLEWSAAAVLATMGGATAVVSLVLASVERLRPAPALPPQVS